jgi:hypothetical protein
MAGGGVVPDICLAYNLRCCLLIFRIEKTNDLRLKSINGKQWFEMVCEQQGKARFNFIHSQSTSVIFLKKKFNSI